MITELHLKHRPTTLEQVVGQKQAVTQLKSFFEDGEISLPHSVLLNGPTGTGKTTMARILARMLGCSPNDTNPNYVERNCADCRSIDDVREIKEAMRYSAIGKSNVRIWVLDEVVQLPTVTQQAFLKIIEEPPAHVWFFLCTTDPSSLIPTFRSRCHPINLQPVPKSALIDLVNKTATKEGDNISEAVADLIAETANGSARESLVLLEAALAHKKPEDQLEAVKGATAGVEGIELARAIHKRAKIGELLKIAGSLKTEPESVRRLILGYTDTVMIRNPSMESRAYCYLIHQAFRDNWYSCGKSGLLSALWEISRAK